jgi:hypothetical protein
VHDLAVGHLLHFDFLGPEGLLVELDHLDGVAVNSDNYPSPAATINFPH